MDVSDEYEFIPTRDRLLLIFKDNFVQIISFIFMVILIILAWDFLTLNIKIGFIILIAIYFLYIRAFDIEKKAFAKKIKADKARYKKRY